MLLLLDIFGSWSALQSASTLVWLRRVLLSKRAPPAGKAPVGATCIGRSWEACGVATVVSEAARGGQRLQRGGGGDVL